MNSDTKRLPDGQTADLPRSDASTDASTVSLTSPTTPLPPLEHGAAEAAPASAASAPAPTPNRPRAPYRLALTILHLAALGIVGFTTIGLLFGALGTGLGLLFVLGVGLVVLVGLVYALYGIGWFETQRVSGLYDLDAPTLRLVPQRARGFKAWLKTVMKQSVDGRMWRALASFGIASVLGAITIGLAQWCIGALVSLFSGSAGWWPFGSLFALLVSAAGIVGLALLHRLITIAIIGSGVSEEQAEQLSQQVRETTAQRAGAVRAADVERTRIERDLHDGVQPRLVSVGMTLGLAQQKIDTDPEAAKALVAEAHTSTKAAITELRQLARGIYASVLDDRGLDAALSALAARSHVPVQLDVRLTERVSRDAEAAVYFAIAESLTNAAKHSRAGECRVLVRVRDAGSAGVDTGDTGGGSPAASQPQNPAGKVLWARVEDNGIGGATVLPGGGLDGITNRVLAAGGTTRLDSPQGGPTTLEVSVPCAS